MKIFSYIASISILLNLSVVANAGAQTARDIPFPAPPMASVSPPSTHPANPTWQTDNGSGFQLTLITQHSEHAAQIPGAPGTAQDFDPIKLELIYPLITSPLTADAKAYNDTITGLIPRWWYDIGGPSDNSQTTDPDTNYTLSCSPGGGPRTNGQWGAHEQEMMLPGVISMTCLGDRYVHGAAHGNSVEWGFNWLVAQRRPIQPLDIFVPNSGWLKALTAFVNADWQSGAAPWAKKLDVADRHHWVLGANGLGFSYSAAEFTGYSQGGDVNFDLIPWYKLAPYLRKDGIVPQKYWQAPPSSH